MQKVIKRALALHLNTLSSDAAAVAAAHGHKYIALKIITSQTVRFNLNKVSVRTYVYTLADRRECFVHFFCVAIGSSNGQC